MELCKQDINTSVLTQSKYSQMTVDDDFNLPETKGDMEKIIAKSGIVTAEEMFAEEGRVRIIGMVSFCVLYRSGGQIPSLCEYHGEIPFEDNVNLDGINSGSQVECHCQLEDLSINLINSRKLEVRGLIGNHVHIYEEMQVQGAKELENAEGMECRKKTVCASQVMVAKRDVLKLREELEIPQNKPNIHEVLWRSIALRNMETKAGDNKLLIRGEMEIFILYRGEQEHLPVQSIFSVRSIYREFDCMGAREDMIVDVDYMLGKGDVVIREDGDGESRMLGCEYNVDMNIRLYEDCKYDLLEDVYSPNARIVPKYEIMDYENLKIRNAAKAKVSARKQIGGDKVKLLQICHVYGDVDVDDIVIGEKDVQVTGVVTCNVLYIATGEDPMSCVELEIPFDYSVQTIPLCKEDSVRILPCLDQLQATLVNSEEMEIKAQINLNMSVFEKGEEQVITELEVLPIDEKEKAAMPGIVGYVVKAEDSIWSIAKKYYTTTQMIKSMNHLESDTVKEGDRLLIVKS
ncbi:MAG: SPOCS domain-containing protein [Wujia sp.]